MTKTHWLTAWLITILVITDILAIATRNTPFVINRKKEHVAAAVKEAETKALRVLAIRNQQMINSIQKKADSIISALPPRPLTAVDRVVRVRCSKSGYSRIISDGTKLHWGWADNYFYVENSDSVTIFGRTLGDDCEVSRGNI